MEIILITLLNKKLEQKILKKPKLVDMATKPLLLLSLIKKNHFEKIALNVYIDVIITIVWLQKLAKLYKSGNFCMHTFL